MKFSRLMGEGGWVAGGQIAGIVGSLAVVRILTEYLKPEQYGQLALSLTIGTLVCQVSLSFAMPGIMRFYSVAQEKSDLAGYISGSKRIMGYGSSLIIILGAFAVAAAWSLGSPAWAGLIGAAVVYTLFASYASTISSMQNAARQRAIVAFHSGIEPWLRIGIVVSVLSFLDVSASSVLIAYIISIILIFYSQLYFFKRRVGPLGECETKRANDWVLQIWRYSKPFAIFNFFTWGLLNSDRWALEQFSTTHDVGLFVALYQLGFTPISIAVGTFITFVGPILHQMSGDATDSARNADVNRVSRQMVVLCLLATLIVVGITFGLHGWIFSLFVAPAYREASYLLPWLALAGGLFAAGQILTLKFMSDLNTGALIWPKLFSSLAGIGFNLAGAFYAGLEGVVVAAVLYSLMHFAWLAYTAKMNFFVRA